MKCVNRDTTQDRSATHGCSAEEKPFHRQNALRDESCENDVISDLYTARVKTEDHSV